MTPAASNLRSTSTVTDARDAADDVTITPSPPPPMFAILINLTQQLPFGIIATDRIFDLCATGRQTRCIPQRRS